MKRINIITGHYGSGKTEFAINLAISSKKWYNESIIADLDTVNPYFRTNDAKSLLESKGIRVLAPDYASSNVDLPSVPASVYSVFDNKSAFSVLDVGGDEDGATVLGQYRQRIQAEEYEMFYVINTKRPLTACPKDIIELKEQIEYASQLKITGLVNNTNLGYETTPEILVEGQKIIEEVSEKTGLPLLYIAGTKEILKCLPSTIKTPGFILELNMNLPFMA